MPALSWEDAQTFLAVAETGSFSAAAKSLNVGQPTISRRIKSLEAKIEQQLFTRGKYGAKLTAAADRIMPAASKMAKWATEFDRASLSADEGAGGTVKIACPPGVAVEHLAPFSAQLALTEPTIRLEILSAIDHVDLTRGSADIAIRTHYPKEPELMVMYEFSSAPAVYAAPEYAKKHVNATWQDLDWITWSSRYSQVAPRPMLEKLIPDFAPILASDDYLVQKAAVRAGIGAMICDAPTARENLVRIDVGVTLPKSPFYLVCARSVQHVAVVNKVVGLIVANFHTNGHTQIKNNSE